MSNPYFKMVSWNLKMITTIFLTWFIIYICHLAIATYHSAKLYLDKDNYVPIENNIVVNSILVSDVISAIFIMIAFSLG